MAAHDSKPLLPSSSPTKPDKAHPASPHDQDHPIIHPSFEIVKHKSFGTRMHNLWIRFQGEFALSMLETWEMVMLHVIFVLFVALFYFAVLKYFPSHVKIIGGRAKYYLLGYEE